MRTSRVTLVSLGFPEHRSVPKRSVTDDSYWRPGTVLEKTQTDIVSGAEVVARALGVQLQIVEARGPEDFDRAFSTMISARADAMVVLATAAFATQRRRLVELALKNGFRRCTRSENMSMSGA